MENKVYMTKSKGFRFLVKFLITLLIPFFLFGFYKNGLNVYYRGYANFFTMLYPFFYLALSIGVSFIYSLIFKEKFVSYNLLCNILIALVTLPCTNLFLYIIILCLTNLLSKYIKINPVSLFMLFLIGISFVLKNYTFLNLYEQNVEHIYDLFDYIVGYGYGGCANSCLLFSIIALIILLGNKEYKKEIPIVAFLSFYFLLLIKLIFVKEIDPNYFLNNNLIFAFIFIAPISIYSPYSKGACYLYGLLLGLISFIFSFIDISFGVYLAILLLSFVSKYLDNFITSK